METLGNENLPKTCSKFFCEFCDYRTCKKSSYYDHLITAKHKKRANGINLETNGNENLLNTSKLSCNNCSKEFKNRSGLWKHNKKCIVDNNHIITDITTEAILNIIKQNTEFQQMLIEQNKTIIELSKNNQITTHNNTNSHNKSFNMHFFLNETCKNAMNISDFVDSLKLQLSDLVKVGELGYIEGITNIIVKNLNALDVTQRPIHCMDKKRETMYIKDENQWEKDDLRKAKMHTLVRKVANKNISLIQKYREKYPDCIKSTSRFSDQYNKIVIESMGCSGETNEYEKEERIIRKVAREVFVDKECDSL